MKKEPTKMRMMRTRMNKMRKTKKKRRKKKKGPLGEKDDLIQPAFYSNRQEAQLFRQDTLTFTKNKFEAKLADGSGEEGDFKLDSKAKPHSSASFTANGDTRKAIYKWDSDSLHMCVSEKGGETPKDFAGKDGNLFFVLKKAK